jgi:malonate transporter MadL subunit
VLVETALICLISPSVHRPDGDAIVIVFGVALLAICTLVGDFLGDLFGVALGMKANVGGVGLAMILLIAARFWLSRWGKLGPGVKFGIEFWGAMYIPIVVAMAAQQNVASAVKGSPIVIIAAVLSVVLCFGAVALLGKGGRRDTPPNELHDPGRSIVSGELSENGVSATSGAPAQD